MSKLVFTYGAMGSAKTANALMKYFELKTQGKKVLLLKPSTDSRDGEMIIKSRIGLSETAKIFGKDSDLISLVSKQNEKVDTVILDEAQFCNRHHIDELKKLTVYHGINVYAYGLKTNFMSELFEGSKRLIEIADELRSLEMTCAFCEKQAEINARFERDGRLVTKGEVIVLGSNDKYKAICYKCWKDFQIEK